MCGLDSFSSNLHSTEASRKRLVMKQCILNAYTLDSSTPLRCAQNDIFYKEPRGYPPEF